MAGVVMTSNQAWGLLSTAVATTDTTITLQSGQGSRFPSIVVGSGNWFYITLIDSSNNLERCMVTATSGDQFTITRGVDNSSPRAFASGCRVENRWTSAAVTDIQAQINTVQSNLTNAIAAVISELNTAFPVGMIMQWHGTVATIPTGWTLCNGANSTPNLTNSFVIGAGSSYNPGTSGGAASVTLSTANMPSHNHGISDPGHAHSVYDPGHNHGVNDPGHAHGVADPGHVHSRPAGGWGQAGQDNGGGSFASASNQYGTYNSGNGGMLNDNASGTGIGIYGSGTGIYLSASGSGIGIYAAGTGVTTVAAGGGAAFAILPPYYALCYIMRTGSFS